MKATTQRQPLATGGKIIPLGMKRQRTPRAPQRFKIQQFQNRAGSLSWRVSGCRRDGGRVRENFSELESAQCRQVELETEYLRGHAETTIRATKLSAEQVQLAEVAFIKLGDDWQRILDAVDYWRQHGKQRVVVESPRIDDAVERFKAWLDDEPDENGNGICTLREHSRHGLRTRVGIFANSIGNLQVNDITIDVVEGFLGKLKVSPVTRDNYKRAVSRFFAWCIARPRRWATTNPCAAIRIEKPERPPPVILTVKECKALLRASEAEGLAPYVAIALYGGLRPFELSRLSWSQVNLKDKEIRLEGNQTKTGRARVVSICPTLACWLASAPKKQPLFPRGWRKKFDRVKRAAGFGGRTTDNDGGKVCKPWVSDQLRHTAISHRFRLTGSYGECAEAFGNSEAIIKAHYQGRVSSEDTKKFYALRPKGGQ